MQSGFAMLEAGSVRYKNYQSSLIKNTAIPIVCGLAWYTWGYAFSFGGVNSGFIGHRFFAITKKMISMSYLIGFINTALCAVQ